MNGPDLDVPAAPAHDLRMPVVAAAAWLGGVAAHHWGLVTIPLLAACGLVIAAVAAVARCAGGAAAVAARRAGGAAMGAPDPAPSRSGGGIADPGRAGGDVGTRRDEGARGGSAAPRTVRVALACLLVALGVAGVTVLRGSSASQGVLPALAGERAVAELTGTVVSDPVRIEGAWGEQVLVRLRVATVTARGATYALGAVVVVLGDPAWRAAQLGSTVRAEGRLAPADDEGISALLTGARPPVRIRGPDVWWRAAAAVRAAIRDAVSDRPADQRALVPALVDGDDGDMPDGLEADFRTTGLTHLTAVSGTNLTLVVGCLLLLARSVGVRRRWLTLVGLLGIVGFVLLARAEPSVLRAAAMGAVGLFALGTDGRRRGLRALGVAVTVLLLASPGLSISPGFALSVLATAGIVAIGPPVQDALAQWLPRVIAAAIAVPFAAQLACTPVVAALSGSVSLVAVLANLLAEPAVGPATVLGLAAGLLGLVWAPLGRAVGLLAGTCVSWIVTVAEHGAGLPHAAVPWGSGVVAIGVLGALCAAAAVAAPVLLRRRRLGAALVTGSLLVVTGVPGGLLSGPAAWFGSWPPTGWVAVACDVGQGDAIALSVGPHTAIVVDAGPEPARVDRCLDRLGVTDVPLLVLTHFHADHVDGLPGVLDGRTVGAIETSPMLDPRTGVDQVRDAADEASVPLSSAVYGTTRSFGDLTLQVLWPDLPGPVDGPGDGTAANDSSVVLLVVSHGVRLLLTGDIEPPGQGRLAAAVPGLEVDVVKVPHHGSSHQDLDWLRSLHAGTALVSVGADNDYGHPDPDLLGALTAAGTVVARTDQDGDLVVVAGEEGPGVVTSH